MFRRKKKKQAPVIPPRVVNIDKGFYELSFEEQRQLLRSILGSMSPNEDVRKAAQEDLHHRKNRGL